MKENCDSELRGRFQNNDYVIVSLFFCQMLTCQVNISKNRWELYFFFLEKLSIQNGSQQPNYMLASTIW